MCAYVAERQRNGKQSQRWAETGFARDYVCTFRRNCIEKRRIMNFALAFSLDTWYDSNTLHRSVRPVQESEKEHSDSRKTKRRKMQ